MQLVLNTNVAGHIFSSGYDDFTWAQVRGGLNFLVNQGYWWGSYAGVDATYTPDMWWAITRGLIGFNTALIPVGAIITEAILSIYGQEKALDGLSTPDFGLVGVTPTDPLHFVGADWSKFAFTRLSDDISYANFLVNGFNDYILNAAGLAFLNLSGQTTFGLLANHDIDNIPPTWSGAGAYHVSGNQDGAISYYTKLTITYTLLANPSLPADKKQPSGYHCFVNQYMKNSLAGYNPLKLPTGEQW